MYRHLAQFHVLQVQEIITFGHFDLWYVYDQFGTNLETGVI